MNARLKVVVEPKARRKGDRLDRDGAFLEQPPGDVYPGALHIMRQARPLFGLKQARQVPRADADLVGQRLETQIPSRIVQDEQADPVDRAARPRLGGQRCAELRLPAGPLEEHDEPACDEEGETTAMVLLDQREGEIDGRGDAGRTEYRTVPNEDAIGLDRDVGIGSGQPRGILPVRGGASSGEQPGMGQQEGAGTSRPITPRALGLISKPLRHTARSADPARRTVRRRSAVSEGSVACSIPASGMKVTPDALRTGRPCSVTSRTLYGLSVGARQFASKSASRTPAISSRWTSSGAKSVISTAVLRSASSGAADCPPIYPLGTHAYTRSTSDERGHQRGHASPTHKSVR